MKRRELFRRSILGTIGAVLGSILPGRFAEARTLPAGYDASRELSRSDWKPVFLDPHQNETLTRLSDLIIPETDTPGAKVALVNRFIDRLLEAEATDRQREFLNGLAYLDGGMPGALRQDLRASSGGKPNRIPDFDCLPRHTGDLEE